MEDRSYAQIRWQQNRFGLLLVNTCGEKFFLYADKLQELYDNQNDLRVLKLRDRKPSRAIGYYPGQVVGTIDMTDESVLIRLYIGEPYRDLKIDPDIDEPADFLVAPRFLFPVQEFMRFKRTLDIMLEQERIFSDQIRTAEMTPLAVARTS